jgi:hypothetical protein
VLCSARLVQLHPIDLSPPYRAAGIDIKIDTATESGPSRRQLSAHFGHSAEC